MIETRAEQNKQFTEKELINLLKCVSGALLKMEKNNIKHGHITTNSILIIPD